MDIIKTITQALDEKKAVDIQVLKIDELTTIADYFVICTGTSNTHINTLKEYVEFKLEQEGVRPHHVEGYGSGSWVLMDYLSVAVHLFTEQAREFYSLDKVWADAVKIDIE